MPFLNTYLNLHNLNSTALVLLLMVAGPLAQDSAGQSYQVRHYAEEHGLPSSAVRDITQTSDGIIWFATRAGISAYDGQSLQDYNRTNGLFSLSYYRLAADDAGGLWAFTDQPARYTSRFVNGSWRQIPSVPDWQNYPEIVAEAVATHDSTVSMALATAAQGILLLKDDRWTRLRRQDGLPSDTIKALTSIAGRIIAVTASGVCEISSTGIDILPVQPRTLSFRDVVAAAMTESEEGGATLWLCGRRAAEQFSANGEHHAFPLPEVGELKPFRTFIRPDSHGGFYYGSPRTLYYLHKDWQGVEMLDRRSGLLGRGATSVFQDREDNIWITSLRGVSKIISKRFTNYHSIHGTLEDEVSAVEQLPNGKIVLGHPKGLSIVDGNQIYKIPFPASEGSNRPFARVMDLEQDQQGRTWIATRLFGAGRLVNDSTIAWAAKRTKKVVPVIAFLKDLSGRFWACDEKKLYQLIGNRLTELQHPPLGEGIYRKLFQGPGDTLYVSSSIGLMRFAGTTMDTVLKSPGATRFYNSVFAVLADRENKTLIGTQAGLAILKQNKIHPYETEKLKVHRPIYFLSRDAADRLWIGTDRGAILWDGQQMRQFGVQEGLSGFETNRDAGFLDDEGSFWIGTNRGVSRYRQLFDRHAVAPPLLRLLSLSAGGKNYDIRREIELAWTQNHLDFQGSVISFVDEDDIYIQSRLENHDNSWTPKSRWTNQYLHYSNLPPGTYRLSVRAKNRRSEWSTAAVSANIKILAPIWQTTWFRLAMALFVVALFAAIYFVRLHRIKKSNLELAAHHQQMRSLAAHLQTVREEERTSIARELHDEMGQELTALKLELSMLEAQIGAPDVDVQSQRREIKSMKKIIDGTIDKVSTLTLRLRPGILDQLGLIAALKWQAGEFHKRSAIAYTLNADMEELQLDNAVSTAIFRIFQEALTNIARHSQATRVEVNLTEDRGGGLSMRIADNGIGIRSTDPQSGKSFGLLGMRERALILGGTMKISDNQPSGVIIEISLPGTSNADGDVNQLNKELAVVQAEHPVTQD